MNISALVPAYNEVDRLPATLDGLRAITEIDEVIVIDDGSTDNTAALAASAGAAVVRQQHQGKAAAVWNGLQRARGELIMLADADLEGSAAELAALIPPVVTRQAEMTIACPDASPPPGGLGAVKKLAAWGIYCATGFICRSPLSGQRLLRREIMETIERVPRGFGLEVALTIHCLQQGMRIIEIPIPLSHRFTGRDVAAFYHRGRQFGHVARELWHWKRLLLGKRR